MREREGGRGEGENLRERIGTNRVVYTIPTKHPEFASLNSKTHNLSPSKLPSIHCY